MEWATKPFFVNGYGVKVNAQTYERHLQKDLLPAVQRLYIYKNWIFVQNNALPHRSNLLQDFLQEHSIHVLSKHMNGPPRYLIAIPWVIIFGIK